MGEGDEGPLGYFMPMIDMLNHHPYGSRYEHTDDGDWLIRVHHPTPTDQVFVRYNKADSFGVALGLGYFEADTRFVSSVACRVGIPDVVEVKVAGWERRAVGCPPPVSRSDDGLVVRGWCSSSPAAMPSRSCWRCRCARCTPTGRQPSWSPGRSSSSPGWWPRTGFLHPAGGAVRPGRGRVRAAPDLRPVARRQLELLAEWD